MKPKIEFQTKKYHINISKEFIHDDLYEENELVVFVRGNGFWPNLGRWLNAKDLARLYRNQELSLDEIDGTFFIIIQDLQKNELQLISDHLNFFPLYINEVEEKFQISDSLSQFKNLPVDEIALKQLFSISSIIGNKTLYQGVLKLPPACITTIHETGERENSKYWNCDPIPTNSEQFKEILKNTIALIPQLSKNPSLTLTAGLDSRMIFSELKKQNIEFEAFTFGHKNAVDLTTAQKISADFKVRHSAYQVDIGNSDFVRNFNDNSSKCVEYSDGMIPYMRGAAADYCFKQQASNDVDMIVTATGELVYSHYAEVPTIIPKDNSSIESIAKFLIEFNADKGRPTKYQDVTDVIDSLVSYFKEYSLSNNILFYDAFYLCKLSGLTSYYQQFLSSNIRIFNPIFTKTMINHSMGLNQSLRDHRKLQRDIIVENMPQLNNYLVNGFKVVKPTLKNTIRAKFNYGIRLSKKLINRISRRNVFSVSYLDYLPILKKNKLLDEHLGRPELKDFRAPTYNSSESYIMNYLSINNWFDHIN